MHTPIRELKRDRRDIADPGQQNTEISRAFDLHRWSRPNQSTPHKPQAASRT